ncbi:MAG: hypothetical protein RR495_00995 [Anaerovoracaceae bacterium]
MNSKGSSIVEATIAFPIVILSLIGIISIFIFMYSEATKIANSHVELVTFAGKATETMESNFKTKETNISEGTASLSKAYLYNDYVTKKRFGLITSAGKKSIKESLYKIDEKKLMRAVDFIDVSD